MTKTASRASHGGLKLEVRTHHGSRRAALTRIRAADSLKSFKFVFSFSAPVSLAPVCVLICTNRSPWSRMSGSKRHPLLTPIVTFMLLAAGCGTSEQGSTLRSDSQEANPIERVELNLEPATPANLYDFVLSKARALALIEYSAPDTSLPADLANIDYSGYQAIRFDHEAAIWNGESPFEVHLFHRGFLFKERVRVHVVDTEVAEMPFDSDLFEYGNATVQAAAEVAPDLGYSGFRVTYPLNNPGIADEIIVFQGASYFRLLGPGHVYGLSGRGLAVRMGGPGAEEFPDFREFWLVKPEPGDNAFAFYGLLDSPSLTGVYQFELVPEENTTVLEVDAHLFARNDVSKLGIAPMSSMFLYGPNQSSVYDDFRLEVHDSDGLLMQTRLGEWIWRPLSNRRLARTTSLRDIEPRGFGLVQRARNFDRYLDLEALYHRRPSHWVHPLEGDWGGGGVELLELPTDSEFRDNIAIAWVPDYAFQAGQERHYRYRLTTFDERLDEQTLAHVERTGIGRDALPGEASPAPRSQRRFIVDFRGGLLDNLASPEEVQPVLNASSGTISDLRVAPLPSDLGWRVSFRLVPDAEQPADMRLYLIGSEGPVSETWTYVWYPDELQ